MKSTRCICCCKGHWHLHQSKVRGACGFNLLPLLCILPRRRCFYWVSSRASSPSLYFTGTEPNGAFFQPVAHLKMKRRMLATRDVTSDPATIQRPTNIYRTELRAGTVQLFFSLASRSFCLTRSLQFFLFCFVCSAPVIVMEMFSQCAVKTEIVNKHTVVAGDIINNQEWFDLLFNLSNMNSSP